MCHTPDVFGDCVCFRFPGSSPFRVFHGRLQVKGSITPDSPPCFRYKINYCRPFLHTDLGLPLLPTLIRLWHISFHLIPYTETPAISNFSRVFIKRFLFLVMCHFCFDSEFIFVFLSLFIDVFIVYRLCRKPITFTVISTIFVDIVMKLSNFL